MSATFAIGECRKFNPNIFNKAKCSHCFKLKELHSEAALEVSKASRNVTRCGFLFVAPDWDFTNPVYRTKRWQRRWFVLFDDGELTYAIDDNPETIPQSTINMATVFEITSADAITGNANSIAIVAPDGIHFIKGSCSEESRLWLDILKLFAATSTSSIRKEGATGRAKRSATFPGIRLASKASSLKKQQQQQEEAMAEEAEDEKLATNEALDNNSQGEDEDTEEDDGQGDEQSEEEDEPAPMPSVLPTRTIEKRQSEHFFSRTEQHRELRGILRREESTPELLMSSTRRLSELSEKTRTNLSNLSNLRKESLFSENNDDYGVSEDDDEEESVEDEEEGAESEESEKEQVELEDEVGSVTSRKSSSDQSSRRTSFDIGQSTTTSLFGASSGRGQPDGCGLMDVKEKKGWLMKETSMNNWHKYWFVLKDGALMYYRDPAAETKGFLDGVIGLNTVESVREQNQERNFGFNLRTSEPKVHKLSAVTAGIRQKWMDTIKAQMSTDGNTSSMDSSGQKSSGYGSSRDQIVIPQIKRLSSSSRLQYTSTRETTESLTSSSTRTTSTSSVETAVAPTSSSVVPTSPEAPSTSPSLHDKLLSLHTQLDTQKDLLQEQKTDNFKLRRQMETLDQKLQEANVQTRLESEKVMELLQENAQLNRAVQEHKANAEKWKDLYDSIYLQVGKCQSRISHLELLNSQSDEQLTAKDQIVSDLSDQLKDSEDRIQDLIAEIDQIKKDLVDNKNEYEDSLSKVIIAMDNQYSDKLESQRKHFQEETAKLNKLESELSLKQYVEDYFPQFSTSGLPMSNPGPGGEGSEPAFEIFADLYSRFQSTLKQNQDLKQTLRESTALNDTLEVEKLCLEQALKRTISLNEEEEKMLVTRIEDLTNKLLASEKSLRQAKERRSSRSKRSSVISAAQASAAASAPVTPSAEPTHQSSSN